jgi:hypothetical protein
VIVIFWYHTYASFNDQSTCSDVEMYTQFDENEADERDVTYNGVAMPLQNPDGDENI